MPELSVPRLSVVIPARNEAANLAELLPEIVDAAHSLVYEIIVVDDGSTDTTRATIEQLARDGVPARCVVHPRSLGQSAALFSGVGAARGAIILTLDGDGQNDPGASGIPAQVRRSGGRPCRRAACWTQGLGGQELRLADRQPRAPRVPP